MKFAAVLQFAHMLGASNPEIKSEWVNFSCPLARTRHAGGQDRHPSFGIKVVDDGWSCVNCLACHVSGDLLPYLWAFQHDTGRDVSEIAHFVREHDRLSVRDLEFRFSEEDGTTDSKPQILLRRLARATYAFSTPAPAVVLEPLPPHNPGVTFELTDDVVLPALPEEDLDGIRSLAPAALSYLTGPERQLTPETIVDWELGWHADARRIVIPIRDVDGRLVGISGRSTDDSHPKYLHSRGYHRDFYLYGEHRAIKGGVGYLVEGFFDVQKLWQCGYKSAVALLGTHLSYRQRTKLLSFFTKLVILLDGDEPGRVAAAKVAESLEGRMPYEIVLIPGSFDPSDLNEDAFVSLIGPPPQF